MNKHLAAIQLGTVDKSNIIGIRKALAALERRERGYSVSCTAPKLTLDECDAIENALREREPLVTGSLVESGLAVLRNPRYRKRLASVAHIVVEQFRLVRFDDGTPVYRACGANGSFLFKNVPWQSGGHGPELL